MSNSPIQGTELSPQELKRKTKEIHQSVVIQVLDNPPDLQDVPAIREFLASHSSLQQEIEATRQRISGVSKAKAEYETLEQNFRHRQQELTKAESALASLHRGFGKAAFEAFLAGHVKDQPAFANRMAIHTRLQQLRNEYESLAPSPQAGLLEKGKATAKHLMVAGKIKLEELKIGGADTEIGKHLIEARQEESVRCEATSTVLGQIAGSSKDLADRQKKYEDAKAAVESKGSEICASFALQRMEGSRTLDAELSRCRHLITQKETELVALKNGLPDKLLAATTLPQDSQLAHLLTELHQAEAELQAAPPSPLSGLCERLAKARGQAQPKNRTLAAIGSAVFLILLFTLVVVLRQAELRIIAKEKAAKEAETLAHQQAVATEIAKANELWDSGRKTDAVIKYKEVMKERRTVEDKSPFALVYGRVIEREAEKGDTVAARSMIKEALESSISLTLSSAKANSLLTQVHRELEAEERELAQQAEADQRRDELAESQEKKTEAGNVAQDTPTREEPKTDAPVAGRDYYPPSEDAALGSRAMTVEQDGKPVLVRRKIPPEHIGLGVTGEGYEAIENEMTEEEVKSILKSSGKVGTVDESHKFVKYKKNFLETEYIQVVYRPGYKGWVVEDKDRYGF